jgi:hypothetical protein
VKADRQMILRKRPLGLASRAFAEQRRPVRV